MKRRFRKVSFKNQFREGQAKSKEKEKNERAEF